MKHTKDIFKRTLISLFAGIFLGYIGFLYTQGAVIVSGPYLDSNVLAFLGLIGVALFFLVLFGVYPVHFKFTKLTVVIIGIMMIVLGDTTLINTPEQHIYIQDITKILGVILVILGPTNILISKKIQQKSQQKKMEIIEV